MAVAITGLDPSALAALQQLNTPTTWDTNGSYEAANTVNYGEGGGYDAPGLSREVKYTGSRRSYEQFQRLISDNSARSTSTGFEGGTASTSAQGNISSNPSATTATVGIGMGISALGIMGVLGPIGPVASLAWSIPQVQQLVLDMLSINPNTTPSIDQESIDAAVTSQVSVDDGTTPGIQESIDGLTTTDDGTTSDNDAAGGPAGSAAAAAAAGTASNGIGVGDDGAGIGVGIGDDGAGVGDGGDW